LGFNLDLLGILGSTKDPRLAAARTTALFLREFDELLANGQVRVIPSLGPWSLRLLPATPNRTLGLGIFQIVAAVHSGRFFRATAEEVGLQLEILPGELVSFLFGGFKAFEGPRVHRLPETNLLLEALVVPLQAGNLVA
jgi:hypothetical protein